MKQTISELNESELDWIAKQLELAAKIVRSYSPEDSGKPISLAALDRAFHSWTGNGGCGNYQRGDQRRGDKFWPDFDGGSRSALGGRYR